MSVPAGTRLPAGYRLIEAAPARRIVIRTVRIRNAAWTAHLVGFGPRIGAAALGRIRIGETLSEVELF